MGNQAPSQNLQGIVVPNAVVDPAGFMQRTRRLTFSNLNGAAWNGLGNTNLVQILQTGILAGLLVRVTGTVVTLKGSGAIGTTGRWPYDLVKRLRVSANGQSNLINCSGWKLKARDMMQNTDISDKGVAQSIANTTVYSGTLSQSCESWGVGQLATAIADATYNVELHYYVPLAFDQQTLTGAIFAQTASTDISLSIDWAQSADLFTLTSNAAVTPSFNITVEPVAYSIPEMGGQIIVPDLSAFHGIIESRQATVALGDNEVKLAGQGVGRQLLRMFGQTWNGTVTAPLALTDANYGQLLWRFGGNDTPETFPSARINRFVNERLFNSDIGGPQGYWCHDFAHHSAFRDSIDEGAASELRFLENIASGVTLTNPGIEYVQETVFAGAA